MEYRRVFRRSCKQIWLSWELWFCLFHHAWSALRVSHARGHDGAFFDLWNYPSLSAEWRLEIQPRTEVKNLGVVIDHHLSWDQHISQVTRRCFGMLTGLAHLIHSLPETVLSTVVSALVLSHVRYCLTVVEMEQTKTWTECKKFLTSRQESSPVEKEWPYLWRAGTGTESNRTTYVHTYLWFSLLSETNDLPLTSDPIFMNIVFTYRMITRMAVRRGKSLFGHWSDIHYLYYVNHSRNQRIRSQSRSPSESLQHTKSRSRTRGHGDSWQCAKSRCRSRSGASSRNRSRSQNSKNTTPRPWQEFFVGSWVGVALSRGNEPGVGVGVGVSQEPGVWVRVGVRTAPPRLRNPEPLLR